MTDRPNCQARVTGDEYHCYKCGLVWDIADLDPPTCRTVFNVLTTRIKPFKDKKIILETNPDTEKKYMKKMRDILKT